MLLRDKYNNGWTLAFHLPADTAEHLQVGGDATLTSREPHDRGTRVTGTGTGPLQPGHDTTLTLTTTNPQDRVVLTDIELDGARWPSDPCVPRRSHFG